MPAQLPNTTTTDNYKDVVLGGDAEYAFGSLTIANKPVSIILEHGERGLSSSDEYPYMTPTTLPLVGTPSDRIVGVKVKSAIVGQPAQVSGWLVEPGKAGIQPGAAFTSQIAAGGSVTPGQSSVQIQKNGVLIGTEPILDFVDGNGITWTAADDAANTRVTITAVPKTITGTITGAGAITGGTGFTCARTGAGAYQITFNPVLAISPVVNISTTDSSGYATPNAIGVNSFQCFTYNAAGALTDHSFNFTATPTS